MLVDKRQEMQGNSQRPLFEALLAEIEAWHGIINTYMAVLHCW